MRRVLVIGCGGAGKSTLAARLAERTTLPLIHLDQHFWGAGWKASEAAEWRDRVSALAALPAWIMDGNYSASYDIRMPRADTLVWLDYPRAVCMRRVLWRTLRDFGRTRRDSHEGCREHFDIAFLRYVWEFPVKHRSRIVRAIDAYGSHLRLARFPTDADANAFLATVGTD